VHFKTIERMKSMAVNIAAVGEYITILRKSKGLTQNNVAERLNISYQAVSKWERGESLPDIMLLPELAAILETTVDSLLSGGEKIMSYTKKITFEQMKEGVECIDRMGELLGRGSTFYIGAIEGINRKMNIEFEDSMKDSFIKEAMIAEAIVQNLMNGAYIDISDVKRGFVHEHWVNIVCEYAAKYGIS